MISVGGHFSGPELRGTPIDRAISAVMKFLADNAKSTTDAMRTASVNVVFCVPGSMGHPDWDSGRVAKYSSKRRLVLVQFAVPEEAVHSDYALDVVIMGLRGANALAFDFYLQKGIDYPLSDAESLVDRIRRSAAASLNLSRS